MTHFTAYEDNKTTNSQCHKEYMTNCLQEQDAINNRNKVYHTIVVGGTKGSPVGLKCGFKTKVLTLKVLNF